MSPELRQIDPRTVTIGTNVRSLHELDDPDFVASVRELGVLTPITVNETEHGYELRYGQRRLLAAIAAERETVPALVLPAGDVVRRARLIAAPRSWTRPTGGVADHLLVATECVQETDWSVGFQGRRRSAATSQ